MEDVIVFLLFAYLFVLRPILKRLRATRGGPGSSPKPSLGQRLETLRQKLREAAEQTSTRPTGQRPWEEPPAGEAFPPSGEAPTDLAPGSVVEAEIQEGWLEGPGYLAGERSPEPGAPEAHPLTDQLPEPPPGVEGAGQGAAVTAGATRGRVNLRRAVVWSEILGLPVGLRDP